MATLGDYELGDEIGRGGMGRVLRARHLPTGATRAVKVLEGVPDVDSLDRFRREAESLARVAGRGVVVVHGSGVERGRLWFAMDLLPGGSLRDVLVREGRLEWRRSALLVSRLARVLERCAAAGLVHRDVKPENVLLDEAGEPCLSDFGCVRDLSAASLTATGVALGTTPYMAPEQLLGERPSPAADVWALGVLLHELVAGERPFHGPGLVAFLEQARAGRRPSLTPTGAPASLDTVVGLALAPDPTKRPAAGLLARRLEALASGEKVADASGRGRALAGGLAGLLLLGSLAAALARRTDRLATGPDARSTPGAPRSPGPSPSSTGRASLASPSPVGSKSLGHAATVQALERARRSLDRESCEIARAAVAPCTSEDFAGAPDESARLVAACVDEIRILEQERNVGEAREVLRTWLRAEELFALARRIEPGCAVPAPLGRLALSAVLGVRRDSAAPTDLKGYFTRRLQACDRALPFAAEQRGDLLVHWALTVEDAAAVPGPLPLELPALLAELKKLFAIADHPVFHYVHARVLKRMRDAADDGTPSQLERDELASGMADEGDWGYWSAQRLAEVLLDVDHDPARALAVHERGWRLHPVQSVIPYAFRARVLLATGHGADALATLRDAQPDESASWLHDLAVRLERGLANGDAAEVEAVRSALAHEHP